MKGIKEFYDRTAAEWADKWYADEAMLPLLRKFFEYLPDQPKVLDLCCGAGYESRRMAGLGAEVVGFDLSPASIEIAIERNPELKFFAGDMLQDYSYIGKVDGIACIAGLVHIHPDEAGCAFEHMAQVLKPGGYVLLVVRDGEGYIERQSRQIIDGEEYDRAFYGYTREKLTECADGLMEFVCEIADDEPSIWRNYIFRKI